jgi:glutamate racemase
MTLRMHIVITDSGVGGLSVCAYAERFVREQGFRESVKLTFANAAPANDYGYNSMPSRDVKLQTFDRFLARVSERYSPDLIYVACNTLSVLLPDVQPQAVPVKGIVVTGVDSVMRELGPQAEAMIFGTQTTIDSAAYRRLLEARGVEASRIISQACPGLADTISEDRGGIASRTAIQRWVGLAIDKLMRRDVPVVACLACTHYGYRRQLFADVFAEAGIAATVVDPNERAVDDIFVPSARASHDVDVAVVTAYAIPDATLDTLGRFLAAISPRTVAALRGFDHQTDLC